MMRTMMQTKDNTIQSLAELRRERKLIRRQIKDVQGVVKHNTQQVEQMFTFNYIYTAALKECLNRISRIDLLMRFFADS